MGIFSRRFNRLPSDPILLGILSMLAGVFTLNLLNVVVKLLSVRYTIVEIAFFRSFFALGPAIAMMLASGGLATLRTERFGSHAGRACIGVSAMMLMFWSYQLMPLADAIAISFSAPLFLTILSGPLLGERVGMHRWTAVLAGFAGVLIMVRPGSTALSVGALVGLAAAVGYALAVISIRRLSRTESGSTIVFYFTAISSLLLALPLPWVWITPSLSDFGLMALTGLLGGVTQYLNTRAFTLAPAAVVGPFNYSAMLWATIFGYLIWGDLPTPIIIFGATVVIASGLYLFWRETRKER